MAPAAGAEPLDERHRAPAGTGALRTAAPAAATRRFTCARG
ncbi:hypothetical protein UA75_13030 [Actinoalloteichus sp. GBA129-24]|uniref:Uncharacterized protein n=1 Tax=Actinoalloteichus fjordicus TaxID=1612552 RepID=A0AAC9PS08_9PSEU|nr:hypothetical protein UA74_12950 [Actinoalloteichus fjordicus]APU20616.1 hypothetical protein UA75_13030 [Actinoalloteichus sp. GBA129-24]